MFESKCKNLKYRKYDFDKNRKLERNIFFRSEIAQELNKIIAVVNQEYKPLRVDSSNLVNALLKYSFQNIGMMEEQEALELIKKEVKQQYDI